MPELPEVETMRRGVLGIVGGRVAAVERPVCRKRPIQLTPRIDAFQRRTVDAVVTAVDRIGKRVVVRLDTADAIVFEPRMTGLVLIADPPTSEHLRFAMTLDGGDHEQLLFWDRRGLGTVRLLTPRQMATHLGPAKLGLDALEISATQLRDALGGSSRAIKVALLDQRAVAGIGNLYAAEILHLAGIHPAIACRQLTRRQWQRLHDSMQQILNEAIRYEGSTLADGTYRNALNNNGGYQNHHRVYDRCGKRCPTCGRGEIQRIVQAQRSTFFCPRCQAKSRR